MKKITLLVTALAICIVTSKAQDTLLFSDFETISFYNHLDSVPITPGNSVDTMWYSCDLDAHPDGSSGGNRPQGYFPIVPFSSVDAYQTIYGTMANPDTNTVLGCNSWTNLGDNNPEDNWLVTPSVLLGSHDTLFWKSAALQMPRYLDGYEVLLSTATNDVADFTHPLFRAAEMVGTPATDPDTIYADYTFAPTGAAVFVHGLDGTYIDPAGTISPISHRGQLRPFSAPLDSYAGQNIFIAFHHNSSDDNMISFDDVMIRGASITNAISKPDISNSISIYPNPFTSQTTITFSEEHTSASSAHTIIITDVLGNIILQSTINTKQSTIDMSGFAKGIYFVRITDEKKNIVNRKIVVQ